MCLFVKEEEVQVCTGEDNKFIFSRLEVSLGYSADRYLYWSRANISGNHIWKHDQVLCYSVHQEIIA